MTTPTRKIPQMMLFLASSGDSSPPKVLFEFLRAMSKVIASRFAEEKNSGRRGMAVGSR
jgi:hypothetical protein